MARVRIRRDAQVALKGAQLPGNVAVLFGAKGSPNIDGRLSEGGVRRFHRRDNVVARDTGSNEPIQCQGQKQT